MKALIIDEFGELENIKIADIPLPEPEPHEVQIKVIYAALNPVDWKIAEGLLRERMPYEFPITLGWDVAGIISKIGQKVSYFKVGEEVFGYARKAKIQDGTLAEYICLDEKNIATIPPNLDLKVSAAIPLTGLTAWQALFDAVRLKENDTIFIHAGAGGVGSLAIQFAKRHGAKVFTTASSENHEYVKSLGADLAIDYRHEDFVKKIQSVCPEGVDVVFDMMGGKILDDSLKVMKPGGHLVSLLQQLSEEVANQHQIKASYVFVQPDGEQLRMIAELLQAKKIIPPQVQEYPFEKAKEALEKLKQGHTKGKIVVRVS